MAVTVITDESQIPPSPEQPRNDGPSEEQTQLVMAARFGEMTESNRVAQEKLQRLELELEEAKRNGNASQAEIRALNSRIDSLIAALEDQETTEEPTPIVPPAPSTPVSEPPKKAKRGILDILING